ncbi:hypothetical protein NPIL_438041 [Nephila pilipes]|uniref:Uncharacterized protein n=1 Tax=Nephila pilipes TaxID=299642 RepID=A0A8X6UQS2_NEPPI|nr:hypothetical protein NPIL_438041 [Nephila pilipes]
MEQESIPNTVYEIQYQNCEPQRSSNSYQQVETEGYNAREQIISQSEVFLTSAFPHELTSYNILRESEIPHQVVSYNIPQEPTFPHQVISYNIPQGSEIPLQVTTYNIPSNPIYSFQDRLIDNNLSDFPLPQVIPNNYSDFVTFPPTTVSNTWERSQEVSSGSSLTCFPNNTACAAPTQMDNCFFGDVMQEGIAPIIFLPEISSLQENELHVTVQTNSSENSEKSVTKEFNSSNSILQCELCYKVFSTIVGHLALQTVYSSTHVLRSFAKNIDEFYSCCCERERPNCLHLTQ